MPGKQGGFFKRLKSKQQKEANKVRRGTTGMRKGDRIKKHNALVDIYAAQRKLRELDQMSQSSSDGEASVDGSDASDSDSDVPAHAKSLAALRGLLGVVPGARGGTTGAGDDASASDSDAASVVSADDIADDDSDDDEEDLDVDAAVQTCALCSSDLSDAVGAVACPDCQQCYCADCHEGTHEAMGHDVVPLDGMDEEDDEEEEEEEDGDDDDAADLFGAIGDDGTVNQAKLQATREALLKKKQQQKQQGSGAPAAAKNKATRGRDDEDDVAGASDDDDEEEEDANSDDEDVAEEFDPSALETGAAEHVERTRAFLPKFDYGKMTDNAAARQGVTGSVEAADPWLATYIADEALSAGGKKGAKAAAAAAADELVDGAHVPALAALADPSELGASNGIVNVKVTGDAAAWSRAHQRPPTADERPSFVVPFIWDKWVAYKAKLGATEPLSPASWAKLNLLMCYGDTNVNTRTWGNEAGWMDAVALHMLNHWAKTVAAMAANDEIVKARKAARRAARAAEQPPADEDDDAAVAAASPSTKKKQGKEDKNKKGGGKQNKNNKKAEESSDDDDDEDLEFRDRGFAKTRLLLVVPMRHQALQYLTIFHGVLGTRDRIGRERFDMFTRDFSEIEEAIDPKFKRRQEDFRKQFAGNINDTFCVGASMRPTGISVYTHVLNSDIIVCSPLGLRRRVSKDADVIVALSSIEVSVIDQANALMMQNWEHVTEMMKLVNRTPSDTTEGLSDLRRVFPWALEGRSAAHRQTVVLSHIAHATVNGFVRLSCVRGNRPIARLNPDEQPGVLPVVTHGVRQHFMRFKCTDLATLDDARLEYFKTVVFPSQVKPLVDRSVHSILLVPSTFDFFKVRVFLDEQIRGSFAELTEHTSTKKQRKALGQFSALERPLLVMTERFYYFRRYFVKHAEALICYSPPLYPHFYAAFVNNLSHESTNATVVCPFTRYDALELQRILGTVRAHAVLTRSTDSFIFASTSKNLL